MYNQQDKVININLLEFLIHLPISEFVGLRVVVEAVVDIDETLPRPLELVKPLLRLLMGTLVGCAGSRHRTPATTTTNNHLLAEVIEINKTIAGNA